MDRIERFFVILTLVGMAGLFVSVAWMLLV